VGLVSRALEQYGVTTTIATWNGDRTWLTKPPRVLYAGTARGSTLGAPGNAAEQRAVIQAALALLERDAPLDPVVFGAA
jgi:hypothetical protein